MRFCWKKRSPNSYTYLSLFIYNWLVEHLAIVCVWTLKPKYFLRHILFCSSLYFQCWKITNQIWFFILWHWKFTQYLIKVYTAMPKRARDFQYLQGKTVKFSEKACFHHSISLFPLPFLLYLALECMRNGIFDPITHLDYLYHRTTKLYFTSSMVI